MADLPIEGPRSAAALGADTGLDPDGLGRLLRLLASLGIFAEGDNGEYVNTPRSETLAKAALFQSAMTGFTGVEADAVAAAYDFSAIGTLVDVGASQGLLLARILHANPRLCGVLFDLPIMLEGATELFAAHSVADRATVVGGDFFEWVPAGDALILKNILHDWDDERCVAILRSCRKATAEGGRVLVVQEALRPGNTPSPGKILDFAMLLVGGRERTQAEHGALFEQAGYELTGIIPTAMPLHVIEGAAR